MVHYCCIPCGIEFDIEGSNVSEHRESNGHQVLCSLFDACMHTNKTKKAECTKEEEMCKETNHTNVTLQRVQRVYKARN